MPPDHVIKMFRRVSYKQHPLIKRVSRCNMSYNGLLFSLVGVTRLELATSRPPDAYSNQLSYTPRCFEKRCKGMHFLNTVQIF